MKMFLRNGILRGLLFITGFQFCSCSCHLINTKEGGSYLRDAEFVTAALRGPAVIATKLTKQGKKALISRLIADFVRIANDGLTFCRLVQEKDDNWYRWTKIHWMIQDFVDCVSLVQNKIGVESQKAEENVLKKFLDNFILPSCEGAAATALAYYGDSKGGNVSLLLQAIISGSRLISEMLESESGSTEQKIVILKTAVHGVTVLVDCIRHGLEEKGSDQGQYVERTKQIEEEVNECNRKRSEIIQEARRQMHEVRQRRDQRMQGMEENEERRQISDQCEQEIQEIRNNAIQRCRREEERAQDLRVELEQLREQRREVERLEIQGQRREIERRAEQDIQRLRRVQGQEEQDQIRQREEQRNQELERLVAEERRLEQEDREARQRLEEGRRQLGRFDDVARAQRADEERRRMAGELWEAMEREERLEQEENDRQRREEEDRQRRENERRPIEAAQVREAMRRAELQEQLDEIDQRLEREGRRLENEWRRIREQADQERRNIVDVEVDGDGEVVYRDREVEENRINQRVREERERLDAEWRGIQERADREIQRLRGLLNEAGWGNGPDLEGPGQNEEQWDEQRIQREIAEIVQREGEVDRGARERLERIYQDNEQIIRNIENQAPAEGEEGLEENERFIRRLLLHGEQGQRIIEQNLENAQVHEQQMREMLGRITEIERRERREVLELQGVVGRMERVLQNIGGIRQTIERQREALRLGGR